MTEASKTPTTGFLVVLTAPLTCGPASSRVPTAQKDNLAYIVQTREGEDHHHQRLLRVVHERERQTYV
ncbi:hypothetical protein PF005_g7818 [Phytophthora fragariae]|uniref:Secreted protein n=2 Tax=Phytophthora TaxID=4783 RepID=A0A6A3SR11_9STRA|nr:hypothetical protein PF003_g37077 [Phytophthora fragariae]KAE9005426.1 hypothetical protein PR002_g16766 [Phytophthora rubi]KAE8934477.1 hypothetical protein PF009_g15544 [Phytophthora fragariae]KAE9001960.1 hypothetical protein PF011_g13512 [Phytophthora fragariae]KAE9007739.1 hypothetical protein PR001_g16890 [Phytophthora rubi]